MREEEGRGYDTKFRYHVRVNGVIRAGFVSEENAEGWAKTHSGEVWEAARNPRGAGRELKYGSRDRARIVEEVQGGMTYRKAAEKYGCSIGYVHKLISEHGKREGEKEPGIKTVAKSMQKE